MAQFLLGMTLAELEGVCTAAGFKRFVAKQLADWLYKKGVRSIDEMTNLSKENRARLSSEYEVGHISPAEVLTSKDGTRKYAFEAVSPGQYIESVMIPDRDRATLCVSSQAGCKMGCKFCMTGRQGFHGNLTAREIIAQFMDVDEAAELTNAVFMGMGEPLDNWDNVRKAIEILTADWGFAWSPKRITLSTIGDLATMKEFLDTTSCHLAVSLHNPFHEERLALMPVENKYPLEEVLKLVRQYDFTGQRRVTFEYIMFAGVNDTKCHADALARLLSGLECRVNLIRFHKIPDSPLASGTDKMIEAFQARLMAAGVNTTIRASRGEDIMAACGLLAGKNSKN
ncbi:MAG: 23S rRNA (adenine(2503)-C(2))-methyltransferase RlmN [Bacteroidales bacterium]|nr:23S rRNA (adenine(2503)-C(2))-methyltransferase RlmN [Bacteroidales bacterium]